MVYAVYDAYHYYMQAMALLGSILTSMTVAKYA
jgi:hypothetical protein